MRSILLINVSVTLLGCFTTENFSGNNCFWGELESNSTYLYMGDSLTAIVEKEIGQGSILFFCVSKGEFKKVYTRDPCQTPKQVIGEFRYYLHKPKYKNLSYDYKSVDAAIKEIPFDVHQTYITGPKGGCFYINKKGNKVYVNRSFCDTPKEVKGETIKQKAESNPTYKPATNTSCPPVQCKGQTQKGERCKNRTTNCSCKCYLHN